MEQLDDDEDWELINDDGFVYKRLKRLRLHPSTSSAPPPPPPDPAAEELNRNKRRKKTLSKLKSKYQKEIHNWELLSNTLMALQNRTLTQQPPPRPTTTTSSPDLSTDLPPDSTFRDLAETLLIQVEAQEASIDEISTLCDVAEAICNAQEQLLKQPFVYLPIWELSPRKLITSLCEE